MASFADLLRAQQSQQESQFDPELFNELLNRAGISQGQMPEMMARANVQPQQVQPQRESYARYDAGNGWEDAEALPPVNRFSSEKAFGGLDEAMASDRRINQAVARETLQNKLRAAVANKDVGQLTTLLQQAQLNQESDLKNREIDASLGLGQLKIDAETQRAMNEAYMRQALAAMREDRADARKQYEVGGRLEGIDRRGELERERAAMTAQGKLAEAAMYSNSNGIDKGAFLLNYLRENGVDIDSILSTKKMKNRP